MDTIEFFMRTAPGERLQGDRLRRLLREWIERTGRASGLVDIEVSPEGDDAVARLRSERRVYEVHLRHEGGTEARRLIVDASTWVMPELPQRWWAWLAGLAAGLLGLVVTWTWLDEALVLYVVGLIGSVMLALTVANATWRRTVADRIRRATEDAGGQQPAREYLEELDAVLRADERVEHLTEH